MRDDENDDKLSDAELDRLIKGDGTDGINDVEKRESKAAANVRPGKGSSNGASLIAQCAADVAPEPVEWFWPQRIALGKLALIAGEAGLGKSQVSIAMAAAVTTGGELPCGEGRAPQGNVVILSAEDGV